MCYALIALSNKQREDNIFGWKVNKIFFSPIVCIYIYIFLHNYMNKMKNKQY